MNTFWNKKVWIVFSVIFATLLISTSLAIFLELQDSTANAIGPFVDDSLSFLFSMPFYILASLGIDPFSNGPIVALLIVLLFNVVVIYIISIIVVKIWDFITKFKK